MINTNQDLVIQTNLLKSRVDKVKNNNKKTNQTNQRNKQNPQKTTSTFKSKTLSRLVISAVKEATDVRENSGMEERYIKSAPLRSMMLQIFLRVFIFGISDQFLAQWGSESLLKGKTNKQAKDRDILGNRLQCFYLNVAGSFSAQLWPVFFKSEKTSSHSNSLGNRGKYRSQEEGQAFIIQPCLVCYLDFCTFCSPHYLVRPQTISFTQVAISIQKTDSFTSQQSSAITYLTSKLIEMLHTAQSPCMFN